MIFCNEYKMFFSNFKTLATLIFFIKNSSANFSFIQLWFVMYSVQHFLCTQDTLFKFGNTKPSCLRVVVSSVHISSEYLIFARLFRDFFSIGKVYLKLLFFVQMNSNSIYNKV